MTITASVAPLTAAQVLGRLNALGAVGATLADDVFCIKGSADGTKKVRFEVDGLTTATTRVLTVPDASMTLAGIDRAQTFSSAQTFSAAVSVIDGNFSIIGSSDATKVAKFEVDGFTSAATRTFTLPDASGTVAVLSLAQSWSALQTFGAGVTVSAGNVTTTDGYLFLTRTATTGQPEFFLFGTSGAAEVLALRYSQDATGSIPVDTWYFRAGGSSRNVAWCSFDTPVVTIHTASSTGGLTVNAGRFAIPDGITAPATESGLALLYVDNADGDLKVKFGDGTIKTIATDT